MKKLLLVSLCFLFYSMQIFAQNRTITGKVTSADDGQPLPGVSVKVQGSSTGTQTNANGEYKLSVSATAKTLIFSYIGYTNQSAAIGTKSVINVFLVTDAKSLSEVVVVGYGTQERRDLTGSVSKISGADISTLPVPSLDKGLAGRSTGVRVTENSGLLGAAPVIRIRGINSISSGTSPLYVVDGIPIITGNQGTGSNPQNPLGDINPEDIASIEVLKDGYATAIYGSRGGNGVVMITTKKGKPGRQTVNYNTWMGVSTTSKRLSVLNAADFITISNEKFANVGVAPVAFPTLDPNGQPYDTNWQNVVFRKGYQQNHALSISGATETSNYYFSVGFADLNGQIVGNSQRKYSVRSNLEQKTLGNILTIGLTTGVTYQQNRGLNSGANGLSGNVTNALLVFPNVPVFNPDGSYNISADGNATQLGTKLGQGANLRQIDNNYTNIAYVLDNNIYRAQNLAFTGTTYLDAKLFSGLNARTQLGVNSLYGEDYTYLNNQHGDGRSSNGSVSQYYLPSFNYDWINTLSYNKTFGDHKIQAVAGLEFQKFRSRYSLLSASNISNPFFGPNTVISNSYVTQNVYGDFGENSIRTPFFARLNYAFKNRYLLGASYREDYISQLGIASAPAKLPGFSVAWRVSDEPFFKSVKSLSFINDLKLRGGYAKTGNSNVASTYAFANLYAPVNYGTASGLGFNVVGNSDLKYETVNKTDAGLDISFLKNRITFTADYYYTDDNNLIQGVPQAPSLGVPGNTILENVGTMTNKGWEFAITSQNVNSKDFSWTTNFNISFNKNRVTSLYSHQDINTNNYNVVREGQSLNAFYGYQYLGVNSANGNPLYQKGNGQVIQGNIPTATYYNYDPANPTALTTANTLNSATDRVILGNASPTYYGGFNNTFTYKGIDAAIFFTFSGGNKVYNSTRQEDLDNYTFNNNGTEILSRWTTPGQVTDVPKLYYGTSFGTFANLTSQASSRYIEDGKFIRAQEITLGYTLPKFITTAAKLSKVRFYGQIQNAFIITKYKGLDPEAYNTGTGVDFNSNPRSRTFVFGLNVGF